VSGIPETLGSRRSSHHKVYKAVRKRDAAAGSFTLTVGPGVYDIIAYQPNMLADGDINTGGTCPFDYTYGWNEVHANPGTTNNLNITLIAPWTATTYAFQAGDAKPYTGQNQVANGIDGLPITFGVPGFDTIPSLYWDSTFTFPPTWKFALPLDPNEPTAFTSQYPSEMLLTWFATVNTAQIPNGSTTYGDFGVDYISKAGVITDPPSPAPISPSPVVAYPVYNAPEPKMGALVLSLPLYAPGLALQESTYLAEQAALQAPLYGTDSQHIQVTAFADPSNETGLYFPVINPSTSNAVELVQALGQIYLGSQNDDGTMTPPKLLFYYTGSK